MRRSIGTVVVVALTTWSCCFHTCPVAPEVAIPEQNDTSLKERIADLKKREDALEKRKASLKVSRAELEESKAEFAENRAEHNQGHKVIEDAGKEMAQAENYLEEYGDLNISAPILAKLNSSQFKFDLNRGATNYYQDAKTQVQTAASAFQQTIQSFGLAARAQWDPTVTAAYTEQLKNYFSDLQRYQKKQNLLDMAGEQQYQAQVSDATNADQRAQALANYAQNYGASSNAPVYPTDDQSNTNLPDLASNVIQRPSVTNVLNSQQFLGPQGLLSGLSNPPNPTLSDRAAVLQSVGDYATESIFRHFMGNTNLSSDSAEDNLFFGLSTVSVNPGWRTKKGWAAEVLMTAEVYYTTARVDVVKKTWERLSSTNAFDSRLASGLYHQYGGLLITTPQDRAAVDVIIGPKDVQQKQTNTATLSSWTPETFVMEYHTKGLTNIIGEEGFQELTNKMLEKGLRIGTNNNNFNIFELAKTITTNRQQEAQSNYEQVVGKFNTNYTPSQFWVISNQDISVFPTIPVPVTVISPLIDAESQDLSDSTRSQTEFTMALSFALRYAGLNAQADAFEQFVKNKQFDIRGMAQSVAVNAFSGADGKFGFQIGPRLRALEDPTNPDKGANYVLDRQSFPVLLILAMDGVDLAPKLWQYSTNDNLIVLEPQIRFTETRRWTPVKHCSCPFSLADWNNTSLTEQKRLEAVFGLKEAREDLALAKLSPDVTGAFLTRIENLEEQMAGGNGKVFLAASDIVPQPPPPAKATPPAFTSTIPAAFSIDTNSTQQTTSQVAFFGAGLDQISTNLPSVFPPEMTSYITVGTNQPQRVGQALTLRFAVDNQKFANVIGDKAVVLRFTTTNSSTVFSSPLVFTVKPGEDKSKKVSFASSPNPSGGFTDTITVAKNANSSDILDLARQLIKSDLEKNKPESPSTNTLLNVTVKPNAFGTNGTFQLRF